MRDSASNVGVVASVVPQTASGNVTGDPVDTLGYDSVTLVVATGSSTGFDVAAEVQASDSTGSTSFAAADSAELVGAFKALEANAVQRVGYVGSKRYVRVVLDHNSGSVDASAVAVLGHAHQRPVA